MKILIIHNSGPKHLSSGELSVARNEVNALKKKGIECELHVIYNDNINWKNPFKLIKTGLGVLWSFSGYTLITELIQAHKPDLVHFHGVLPRLSPAAFYACKKKNIPVIQTLHNFRWLCVEGGLFRKNSFCNKCLKGSGWQGVLYGCAKNSRLISLPLF